MFYGQLNVPEICKYDVIRLKTKEGEEDMPEENARYICPVCDHEIKKGQKICPNCHSWVRKPWIYTGGNLPNEELDGDGISKRDFMDPRSSRTRSSGSVSGRGSSGSQYSSQNTSASRNASSSGRTGSGTSRINASKSGSSGHVSRRYGRRVSGCGPAIVIIIVFLICISVVFGFC